MALPQVQEHMERPVGMALYEMKNGQISNICIQGGGRTVLFMQHVCLAASMKVAAELQSGQRYRKHQMPGFGSQCCNLWTHDVLYVQAPKERAAWMMRQAQAAAAEAPA